MRDYTVTTSGVSEEPCMHLICPLPKFLKILCAICLQIEFLCIPCAIIPWTEFLRIPCMTIPPVEFLRIPCKIIPCTMLPYHLPERPSMSNATRSLAWYMYTRKSHFWLPEYTIMIQIKRYVLCTNSHQQGGSWTTSLTCFWGHLLLQELKGIWLQMTLWPHTC